ncbi:MAG: hypothetical protein ACRC7C_06870, partial [Beijerinckiaceae bacterium]
LFIILLISGSVTACQTTANAPSASAQSRLEREGFRPTSFEDLNKNLTSDDIITTAAYECETPRCRDDLQVSFGRDPGTMLLTEADLAELSGATRTRIARYLNAGVPPGSFVGINIRPLKQQSGALGLTVSAEMNPRDVPRILRGTRFFVGLVYLQQGGPGRMLAVVGTNRAAVARLTDPALLEQ